MDWTGRKVLVTGAGGFIGSHLVEALARRGAGVRALVRYNSRNHWGHLELLPPEIKSQIEVVAGDVRDPFFMDRAAVGVHTIFHLAALIAIPYSYVAPQSYVDTNVTGTLNVLQAALRHGAEKIVHTSTSETYGTALYTPIDEAHPLQGQSPYSASKIGADKLAESFQRSFNLPVATIRPFNTYGPRQSARAVIPTIISQALYRDRVELGSLTPVRDLTFVGDTVEGFIRVAEVAETVGEVTNIGTGVGVRVGELAERILALTAGDAKQIVTTEERVRPERSEVFTLICDNTKARERLGWSPRVDLNDGLAAVIEWVREHPDQFKSELYNV
jgi:NAD dependent epimerase/dehydratase